MITSTEIKNVPLVKCHNCGGITFKESFAIKLVSDPMNIGEKRVVNIPVPTCDRCNTICTDVVKSNKTLSEILDMENYTEYEDISDARPQNTHIEVNTGNIIVD